MMSHILIKDVVMPNNCHECDALGISDIVGLVCNDKNGGYSFKKRPEACPLVEMSPEFPIEELRLQVVYLAGMIAAEQKWVPTSERPPDKNGLYGVTYISHRDIRERRYGNGVADINTAFFQNGNWYVCTEDGIQDEYWHKVIAWMELPKPYEEGKDET